MKSILHRALSAAVGKMPSPFWYLWTGTLITNLGGFVVPFLTLYLTEERGLPVERAGVIVALYGGGLVISSIAGGFLADRIGRCFTMMLGLGLGAIAMIALGYARAEALIGLAAFCLGCVSDMYRPAVSAMIADLVPSKTRPKAYGLIFWALNLGFSVAPMIAGWVGKRNFIALFWIDAITMLVFAILVWFKVPETLPEKVRRERLPWTSFVKPFTDGAFLVFILLILGVSLILQQYGVALPVEMKAHDVPSSQYGLVLALDGLLIIVFQPIVNPWLSKFRRAYILALASALVGLGMGLNGLVHTVLGYALGTAIRAFGEILLSPISVTVVADLAPVSLRGRYQGAFTVSSSFATFVGPLVGALVLGGMGAGALWGGCAVLGLLAGTGQLISAKARRARTEDPSA